MSASPTSAPSEARRTSSPPSRPAAATSASPAAWKTRGLRFDDILRARVPECAKSCFRAAEVEPIPRRPERRHRSGRPEARRSRPRRRANRFPRRRMARRRHGTDRHLRRPHGSSSRGLILGFQASAMPMASGHLRPPPSRPAEPGPQIATKGGRAAVGKTFATPTKTSRRTRPPVRSVPPGQTIGFPGSMRPTASGRSPLSPAKSATTPKSTRSLRAPPSRSARPCSPPGDSPKFARSGRPRRSRSNAGDSDRRFEPSAVFRRAPAASRAGFSSCRPASIPILSRGFEFATGSGGERGSRRPFRHVGRILFPAKNSRPVPDARDSARPISD